MNRQLCAAMIDYDADDPWRPGCTNQPAATIWVDGMIFPICDSCAFIALRAMDRLTFDMRDAVSGYSTTQKDVDIPFVVE